MKNTLGILSAHIQQPASSFNTIQQNCLFELFVSSDTCKNKIAHI